MAKPRDAALDAMRGIGIIRVVVDAPDGGTSSLAGQLGMFDGIRVKTLYSRSFHEEESATADKNFQQKR